MCAIVSCGACVWIYQINITLVCVYMGYAFVLDSNVSEYR
jgi:hypothetical protein